MSMLIGIFMLYVGCIRLIRIKCIHSCFSEKCIPIGFFRRENISKHNRSDNTTYRY